jgi:DNA-binding transcriptional LysR family regulator
LIFMTRSENSTMARFSPDDLAAFIAVAQTLNFRKAAAMRGVSASALSEAVRRLEGDLKVRLLNRTTRSVTPTDAGRRLMERTAPALGTLSDAVADALAGADGVGGTLRLNVPVVVMELVLPRIITAFLANHPDMRVEVTADNRFIDVLAAGFDAGVRYGERVEKDMIAVPIGPREQRFVTAASPAYLARHGVPSHPNELLGHVCLRYRFSSGVVPAWEFAKGGEAVRIVPDGPLISDSNALQLDAARAGLGIVHSFEGFLQPDISTGRLVPVLEDWSERFAGPFLYFPTTRHMPPPLRAFVDHVKAMR